MSPCRVMARSAVWFLLAEFSFGCAGGSARCVDGQTIECACLSGVRGVQTCVGGSYANCQCESSIDGGPVPQDGGPIIDGGLSDGGTLDGGPTSSVDAGSQSRLGLDWRKVVTAAPFGARSYIASATHAGEMWLMGGSSPSGFVRSVWHSADGLTWSAATGNAAFGDRNGACAVSFNGLLWLIAGTQCSAGTGCHKNDVWSSTDGVTWIQRTDAAAFPSRIYPSCVVWNSKIWLIGGAQGTAQSAEVWSSADGIMWIRGNDYRVVNYPNYNGGRALVLDNRLYIIADGVFATDDGSNWVPVTEGFRSGSSGDLEAVAGSAMWLVDGTEIWRSTDGITWVQLTASAPFGRRTVAMFSSNPAGENPRLTVVVNQVTHAEVWVSP